jgi:RND family efflux transporter MFP subunit
LRELSPQADEATRTYTARFTIENPDELVALGMTATVTLSHAGDAALAKLPLAAVLNRGTGPSVYVIDNSSAVEVRPVTVTSFTTDSALISSGVESGDRVVTLGVQKLDAGQKVRIIERR